MTRALLFAIVCAAAGCVHEAPVDTADAGATPADAGTGTCLPEPWRRVECEHLCAPGPGTRSCTDAIAESRPDLCRDACVANQWGLSYCPEGQQ